MKKSKHFRKDVIIARVIFAIICVVIIVLICMGVSALVNSGKEDKNTETTQTESQMEQENLIAHPDVEVGTESESTTEVETESEGEDETTLYVVPTTEVRVRKEPNTTSTILHRIPAGTKTIFLEELEGWYKVEYNGEVGYISADYAEVVEE